MNCQKMGVIHMLVILSLFVQCIDSKERVYFIGAVDVDWDYAPTGKDARNGFLLDNEE